MPGNRNSWPLGLEQGRHTGHFEGLASVGLQSLSQGWSPDPFCKAGGWTPVGPATGPRGAIIVPDIDESDTTSLFSENRDWAGQWEAHDTANRSVFKIAVNASLSDFETVMGQAISAAGANKEVILFTGHGTLGAGPKGETAFNTVPESGGMSTHKHLITQTVLDLDTWAYKDSSGKWVPKPPKGGGKDPAQKEKEKKIKELAPRYDLLQRIGKAMKEANTLRLRLLTCRVGQDAAFVKKLATVMGIKVIAYTDYTNTREHLWDQECSTGSGKKTITIRAIQIWNGPKGSPPSVNGKGEDGPTHSSFSTVPTNNEVRKSP